MALYAIGDLHLCLGAPKPMDVFGGAWVGYMEKLRQGFRVIGPEDTTVLMGDLSWALDLPSARADFSWIQQIPGRKIILKGNHDYWWSTAAKFEKFCRENEFTQMYLLNNNCYFYEDYAIRGNLAREGAVFPGGHRLGTHGHAGSLQKRHELGEIDERRADRGATFEIAAKLQELFNPDTVGLGRAVHFPVGDDDRFTHARCLLNDG